MLGCTNVKMECTKAMRERTCRHIHKHTSFNTYKNITIHLLLVGYNNIIHYTSHNYHLYTIVFNKQ